MIHHSIHFKEILISGIFSTALLGQIPQQKRDLIDRAIGYTGAYEKDAYTVTIPRDEATIVWNDHKLTPNLGLNSWVAFKGGTHDEAVLTAELLLLDDEVDAVLAKALASGLEVTGLASSSIFDGPRLRSLNISGAGAFEDLVTGFRACLDEVHNARAAHTKLSPPKPDPQLYSSIDPVPLDRILALKSSVDQGAYKATTGTTVALRDQQVGPEMGMSTWVSFTGTNEQAMMHGDLVTNSSLLQRVLRAFSQAGIQIASIRNHTVNEQPQVVFVRFWGTGRAADLAAAIRHVLDAQAG